MLDAQERLSSLYETHRDGIYRYLQAQGLSPPVAQEVTQDVFVDLFVAMQKSTHIESERAWLYTVASRAAADYWRRERPKLWVDLDSNPAPAEDVPSGENSPAAQVERRERLGRVTSILRKLPKERQLCLQLRMRGLRYREIANVLKVSTSTVAEWLTSAIDRLREEADG